jgi:hypothetical protein
LLEKLDKRYKHFRVIINIRIKEFSNKARIFDNKLAFLNAVELLKELNLKQVRSKIKQKNVRYNRIAKYA